MPLVIIVAYIALFSVVYVRFLFYCLFVLTCRDTALFCYCLSMLYPMYWVSMRFLFGEQRCICLFRIIINCTFFSFLILMSVGLYQQTKTTNLTLKHYGN